MTKFVEDEFNLIKIKEKEEKTKANDILKKEIIRKLELKFFDIGHMIVNKDTAGHNCNACNILFRKIQYQN